MKQLFAYIRVSTAKQGLGVSLQEQRAAIERYAARTGAELTQWFEERKTAAKAGRPEFARMVKLLRKGRAHGVVIHKIDRSTRNYRDWADIDELIEGGIEVHFASDDLDMRSRGGRLAADIQVVVAVDYIRNLREEALKGIHGRLKQGILPRHAPIGYLDRGAGKPKDIDPVRGPLIRRLFEHYGAGGHSLRMLTSDAAGLGLRNRNGKPLRINQIHRVLRDPFYTGVIRSTRFGLFTGAHQPIVNRALFDRVQDILSGKVVRRTKRYDFRFRRFLRCRTCGRCLVGSLAKGRVYYRCATMTCPTTSVREDVADLEIRTLLGRIQLGESEAARIREHLLAREHAEEEANAARRTALVEALAAAGARLTRLTDLLIDGHIDHQAHDERRASIVMERHKIEQELAELNSGNVRSVERVNRIVELSRNLILLYESAEATQKRRLLEIVMSNCSVIGKSLEFSLREPFASLANRAREQTCRPDWDTDRTFSALTNAVAKLPSDFFLALDQVLPPAQPSRDLTLAA